MSGYLYLQFGTVIEKGRQNAIWMVTVTPATVKSLTRRIKGIGHKLYRDNFISTHLFDDLHTRATNCSETEKIIKECQEET